MSNIGDPITPSVPVVGSSMPGAAADIDAILTEVVARLSSKIPFASLLVNTDFNLNAQNLLNAGYITLTNSATSPGASPVNRVTAFGGDLWYVSPSGAVQITAGGVVNIASTGGFGLDYVTVGALADFTNATDTYAFRQQVGASVRQYAHVAAGDLDLYEFKAHPTAGVPTNRIRIKSPTSLAASYDVTMPAAVPGAQTVVQMDGAGSLVVSNTLGANQSLALTGTGTYKHGSVTKYISGAAGSPANSSNAWTTGVSGAAAGGAAGANWVITLPTSVGDRITGFAVRVRDSETTACTVNAVLTKTNITTNTTLGTTATSAGAHTEQQLPVTGLNSTAAADDTFVIVIALVTGTGVFSIRNVSYTYDRP